MASIQFSNEAALQQAKNLFLSEDFTGAFRFLRECFSDDISNEQILSFLKAEVGVTFDCDDVVFSDESVDEDYKCEVEYILSHYNNLLKHHGKIFTVSEVKSISTREYSPQLPLFAQIRNYAGKLVSFKGIGSVKHTDIAFCEMIRHYELCYVYKVKEDEFLIVAFEPSTKSVVKGISEFHEDASKVVKRFLELNDWI